MALTLPTPEALPRRELAAAPATETAVALGRLEPGDCAVVVRVDTSQPIGRRLLDLGFAPGTVVRALRRAPLGDPMSYELRGTRVCLRRKQTPWIEVARCPDPAPRR